MTSLVEAAAFLCSQWPVFACRADKKPATQHGFKDATQDEAAVRRMFAQPGAALIGVPTGPASGLFVVDVDVRHGGEAWLIANEMRLPRTRTHRTMSGGWHLLFTWPADRQPRNSASKIAPGVDTRGIGGYVVVPPSQGYEIEDSAMPAEAPRWLLDLIDPPAVPAPTPQPYTARAQLDGDGTPYGRAALRKACDAIATASDGAKHETLNREAYSLGGLVSGGHLLESAARAELRDALRAILPRCDDPPAAERTLDQAFRDGMAAPRQVPERPVNMPPGRVNERPQALTDKPRERAEAPAKPALWIDGDTWDAAAIPKRPWLAPGYMLRGSVSVLSGQGAGGKSSLMVAWTVSCAAGEPIGTFAPVGPLVVVNYNTEDDRHEQQRRYSAALQAANRDPALMRQVIRCGPTDVGTLFERNQDTGRIHPTSAMAALERLCMETGADVLICDPLAELHNAEENDNTAMRAVVAAFRGLAQRLGIAVLILHHDRKGNNAPGDMDRMRGASALGGAVRVALTLTTMTPEEANKLGVQPEDRRRHFRIDGAKSNYAPPAEAEWWRISGIEIPNGEHVAAVMPWEPPTPFGGLSATDCVAILHQMDRGTKLGHAYAATKQAGEDWAGNLLVKRHGKTDGQAKDILAAWEQNGLIAVEELEGPRRGHPRKAYRVNLAAVSQMRGQFQGGSDTE